MVVETRWQEKWCWILWNVKGMNDDGVSQRILHDVTIVIKLDIRWPFKIFFYHPRWLANDWEYCTVYLSRLCRCTCLNHIFSYHDYFIVQKILYALLPNRCDSCTKYTSFKLSYTHLFSQFGKMKYKPYSYNQLWPKLDLWQLVFC